MKVKVFWIKPLVLIYLNQTSLWELVSWLNSHPYVPRSAPVRLVYVNQNETDYSYEMAWEKSFQEVPIVMVSKHSPHYRQPLTQANMVLCEATYPTVCELLPTRLRLLILVTLFSSPHDLLRAQQLANVRWGRLVHEEELSWYALWDEIFSYLQSPLPLLPPKVDGWQRASEAISTLIRTLDKEFK
jgi:predicted glycosyltransferase